MTEERAPYEYESVGGHDEERQPGIETHLKSRSTWLRLFFMLVMIAIYAVSRAVVAAVVVLQFFFLLFTGQTNETLTEFGGALARYTFQIVDYLTFHSDERPCPFDLPWPSADS